MKQGETHFQNGVMILAFIYAGISLILGCLFLWVYLTDGGVLMQRILSNKSPMSVMVLQRFSLIIMIAGFTSFVVSLLSGIALMKIRHMKVVSEAKAESDNEVSEDVLTPEELKVVKILGKNDGTMTQKDLVAETKMSKVRIHRLIKRLEAKKVLKKFAYGMTNRIKLEKKLKK